MIETKRYSDYLKEQQATPPEVPEVSKKGSPIRGEEVPVWELREKLEELKVPYKCSFYVEWVVPYLAKLIPEPKRVEISWVEDIGARIRMSDKEVMFVPWVDRDCVKHIKAGFEKLGYRVSVYGF